MSRPTASVCQTKRSGARRSASNGFAADIGSASSGITAGAACGTSARIGATRPSSSRAEPNASACNVTSAAPMRRAAGMLHRFGNPSGGVGHQCRQRLGGALQGVATGEQRTGRVGDQQRCCGKLGDQPRGFGERNRAVIAGAGGSHHDQFADRGIGEASARDGKRHQGGARRTQALQPRRAMGRQHLPPAFDIVLQGRWGGGVGRISGASEHRPAGTIGQHQCAIAGERPGRSTADQQRRQSGVGERGNQPFCVDHRCRPLAQGPNLGRLSYDPS